MKIKHEDLLSIASKLLRDRGRHNTSMTNIANYAGIKKSSLYDRFRNKDDIVRKALMFSLKSLLDDIVITGDWQKDFISALNSVSCHLKESHRCIGLHLLYGSTGHSETMAPTEFFVQLRDKFKEIAEQGLEPEIAGLAAEHSLSLLEGATVWVLAFNDEAAMDRAMALASAIVSDLVTPSEDSEVKRILSVYPAELVQNSRTAQTLALKLKDAEGELLTVRAALAGQIESESCFN